MKVLIINNHTKHLKKLQTLIAGNDITVFEREDFVLKEVDDFDLIIISGGSHVYPVKNHRDTYREEIEFLKTTEKPVIGICLGCEIIAVAFGSTLQALPARERGICEVQFGKKSIRVYEAHRFSIEAVADKLEVLATSKNGPEIIKHKTKPIFGFQFHPEMFVNKTEGDEIFLEIISKIRKQCTR